MNGMIRDFSRAATLLLTLAAALVARSAMAVEARAVGEVRAGGASDVVGSHGADLGPEITLLPAIEFSHTDGMQSVPVQREDIAKGQALTLPADVATGPSADAEATGWIQSRVASAHALIKTMGNRILQDVMPRRIGAAPRPEDGAPQRPFFDGARPIDSSLGGSAASVAGQASVVSNSSHLLRHSTAVDERDQASQKTFGPEFNFTNREINHVLRGESDKGGQYVNTIRNRTAMRRFLNQLRKECGECVISREKNRYDVLVFRVTFPDGFWFLVDTDPGVVEITVKPSTIVELARNRQRIETYIYGTAARSRLVPGGAGHINVGLESTFRDDAMLFRNVLVDFANHAELFRGILYDNDNNIVPALVDSWNKSNAPALVDSWGRPRKFAAVIKRFDDGELRTISELAHAVQYEVYGVSKGEDGKDDLQGERAKFHAVSLAYIVDPHTPKEQKRIEIRGVRMQKNLDQLLLESRLFDRRIEYLRRQQGPIKLEMPGFWLQSNATKLKRFKEYVTESGLPWEDYRALSGIR